MNGIIDDKILIARRPSVLSNSSEGTVVMMDIDSGSYYDLEASAAIIWELLEVPSTMGAICDALEARFNVAAQTCRADVSGFLNDLAGKGLVELS